MHDISRLNFHSMNQNRIFYLGQVGTPSIWYDMSRANTIGNTRSYTCGGTVSPVQYETIINYGTTFGSYDLPASTFGATGYNGGKYITNSNGTYSAWYQGSCNYSNVTTTSPSISTTNGSLFVVFKSPSSVSNQASKLYVGVTDVTHGGVAMLVKGDGTNLNVSMLVGGATYSGTNISLSTWYIASICGNTIVKLNNSSISGGTSSAYLLAQDECIIEAQNECSVAEVMFYNSNLSNVQHDDVYAYLTSKYSI